MVARVIPVDPFDLVVFGGTGDLARRELLPALYRRMLAGHHPGATQKAAHRMKAAGAPADGVQGLELRLGRLAPQHAGGDILNVRHGLCRKVDLEADPSVHLLAAGERHADRLVRNQRQAAAGTVADDAEFVQKFVAQVVGFIHC